MVCQILVRQRAMGRCSLAAGKGTSRLPRDVCGELQHAEAVRVRRCIGASVWCGDVCGGRMITRIGCCLLIAHQAVMTLATSPLSDWNSHCHLDPDCFPPASWMGMV